MHFSSAILIVGRHLRNGRSRTAVVRRTPLRACCALAFSKTRFMASTNQLKPRLQLTRAWLHTACRSCLRQVPFKNSPLFGCLLFGMVELIQKFSDICQNFV